ncbi:MAG: GNAT family N-acetyltransferase [Actinomycetota bacterium]|nr:GNAT family N-acetyltransferase [Actinomycetota bacterium]
MTESIQPWPAVEHPLRLEEIRTELRDGTPVLVRPVRPDDRGVIRNGFARLSPESRYFRFMTPMSSLSEGHLDYLTKLDFVDHVAWLAIRPDHPDEGLGVARYVRTKEDPTIAEAAVTVIDDYQGRGLGTLLLALLATVARAAGVRTFRAFVVQHNARMRNLLEQLGARTALDSPGLLRMDVDLDPEDLPDSPPARVLRAAAQRLLGPVAGPSVLPDADRPRS